VQPNAREVILSAAPTKHRRGCLICAWAARSSNPCNAWYSVTNWRVCASVNDTSTRDQSGSPGGSPDGCEAVAVLGAEAELAMAWVAVVTRSIYAYGPSIGGNPPMTSAASRSVRMASCRPASASQE